ncbi:MAG: VWA domain-containing protein [Oxalobacteraceae bacterium]|nr:VWA domain-containing protein [Oxalobacteraceae bacterium]
MSLRFLSSTMVAIPPVPATLPSQQIRSFADYLREHGFLIGLADLEAMLRVTMQLDPTSYPSLKSCWRGIACCNADQWRRYPDLFDAFWFPHKIRGSTRSRGSQKKSKSLRQLVAQMHADMEGPPGSNQPSVGLDFHGGSGDGGDNPQAMGGASQVDPLHRDFRQWLPEDMDKLESYIRPLEQRLRKKLIRKWRHTHQLQRIDIPATIRQGLSTGGELLKLKRKQRDQIMPRVYVLIDVSKSMESHAPFFLRIGRAFGQILNARVLVFHTKMSEITQLLNRNSGRVQEKINAVTFGFGGGTKIASNLSTFLKVYAGRSLGYRDLVYVLSDGYDTDAPEDTERAVKAIRQRGAKILWLHPMQDIPSSEAMLRSRHLINGFLAVNNLQSLDKLVHLH